MQMRSSEAVKRGSNHSQVWQACGGGKDGPPAAAYVHGGGWGVVGGAAVPSKKCMRHQIKCCLGARDAQRSSSATTTTGLAHEGLVCEAACGTYTGQEGSSWGRAEQLLGAEVAKARGEGHTHTPHNTHAHTLSPLCPEDAMHTNMLTLHMQPACPDVPCPQTCYRCSNHDGRSRPPSRHATPHISAALVGKKI